MKNLCFCVLTLLLAATASAFAEFQPEVLIEVCSEDECDAAWMRPLVRVPSRVPDTNEARAGGEVHFSFDVSPDGGNVVNTELLKSTNEYFTPFARQSLERWKYQPYLVDGEKQWRRGLVAKYKYLTPEESAARDAEREAQKEIERLKKVEANSYCGEPTNPILEIRAQCICKKGVLNSIPYTVTNMPDRPGYVAHFTQATVDSWDQKPGFDIRSLHYRPLRIIGACEDERLCTDKTGLNSSITGEPMDGPIEACVVATWHWSSFSKKKSEKATVTSRGIIKNPLLFLQELPQKQ